MFGKSVYIPAATFLGGVFLGVFGGSYYNSEKPAPIAATIETPASVPEPCVDKKHTVVKNDWLSKISAKESDGNWEGLAKFNKIANPDHIEVGWIITIPCDSSKLPAPTHETQKATPAASKAISSISELSSTNAEGVTADVKQDVLVTTAAEHGQPQIKVVVRFINTPRPASVTTEETSTTARPEPATVSTPRNPASEEQPTGQQTGPAKVVPSAPAPVIEERKKENFVTEEQDVPMPTIVGAGTYTFVATNTEFPGARPGVFPAILVSNQNNQGRWLQNTRSFVTITQVDDENYRIDVPFKKALPEDGILAVDFGDGNMPMIDGKSLATNSDITEEVRGHTPKIEGKQYANLQKTFPKKAGVWKSVVLSLALDIGPTFIGGPAALAVGPTMMFVNYLTREKKPSDSNKKEEKQ